MPEDGLRLAVAIILADARSEDLCTDQRADAAHHVHGTGTREIMEAQLCQPAAAPDPMAGDGIDEQRDGRRIDAVGAELGALRHRAGHNGG